jgi:hypothetical protein
MLFWRKGPSYPNNTLLAIFHSSSDRCKCFVVEAAAAAYTYNPYFLAIVSGADVGGSVRWMNMVETSARRTWITA